MLSAFAAAVVQADHTSAARSGSLGGTEKSCKSLGVHSRVGEAGQS